MRGELPRRRSSASTFLSEAEDAGRRLSKPASPAAALASSAVFRRISRSARIHCERALDEFEPGRGRRFGARERFSDDTGAVAMSILAMTSWQLGEVERATRTDRRGERIARRNSATHPSKVHPLYWKSILEILRGDAAAALITAEGSARISAREHGIGDVGRRCRNGCRLGCTVASPTAPAGAAEMRRGAGGLASIRACWLLVAFLQVAARRDLEARDVGVRTARSHASMKHW